MGIQESNIILFDNVQPSIIALPTTWLVEAGFSAVVVIFSKKRSKLDVNNRGIMRLRLNKLIEIDYDSLCNTHNAKAVMCFGSAVYSNTIYHCGDPKVASKNNKEMFQFWEIMATQSIHLKGIVRCFPFDDHNPPLFEMIDQCCKNLRQWLSEDIDNVVVIHCKAGKGRTGVIISAYLLFTNMFHTASDALAFYDKTRTSDHKGVTIPSQRRYVEYYHKTLYSPKDYSLIPMFITEIIIDHPPFVASLYIVVSERNNILYTSKEYTIPKNTQITIALPTPLKVEGDINLEFYTKSILVKGKLCNYWFNTFFVKNENDANVVVNDFFYLLTYKKNEIDKAVKDKDEKIFNNEFQVTTKMIAELED
ncbi:Mutated in multiple advanced cancers 1 [Intoshia linei]|uniref:Phosphatidylinositol 3,4,5-trisphosphate 3-phosphatase and dual-specificity protein phosphatase PTEN n=1 Tax=Intoshia linei TaxID=1819745 RepID=A0A177B594_9BILA|nr:Mutated in multiple advanced cancers 1 [Intoshia linei]